MSFLSRILSAVGAVNTPAAPKPLRPLVVCVDGSSMSVQASAGHHCKPVTDDGPYTHVEIRCTGDEMRDEALRPYLAHFDCYSRVYFDVPVYAVVDVIARHGGALPGQGLPFATMSAI